MNMCVLPSASSSIAKVLFCTLVYILRAPCKTRGRGSIINLSSTMGQRGAPGASMYTASKHAVEGLTKAAALEGAEFGVRVNAVAPGPVETELLNRFTGSADRQADVIAGEALKRAGKPEEIARALVS